MPSSATITAFYNFSPNTKARATQVNTNFGVLRGHNLPIDPNTAAATDLTWDLGSDDHRWRYGYVQGIDFETSTNTATLLLQGDQSATTGAFDFYIEGTKHLSVIPGGIRFHGLTTTANIDLTDNGSGGWTFKDGAGTDIFTGDTGGVSQTWLKNRSFNNTGIGTTNTDICSRDVGPWSTNTAADLMVQGSTLTVFVQANRVVALGLCGLDASGQDQGYLRARITSVTPIAYNQPSVFWDICRDTVTSRVARVYSTGSNLYIADTAAAASAELIGNTGLGLLALDSNATAGQHYYFLVASRVGATSKNEIFAKFYAYTMF